VLGSAAIAALIEARLTANLPGAPHNVTPHAGAHLPPQVADGIATAMSQSLLLPAAVLLLGLAAALGFARTGAPVPAGPGGPGRPQEARRGEAVPQPTEL
jgi:hypothetical protein